MTNTYNFFIIDLQATHHEVHRLLTFAVLLVAFDVDVVGLVRGTLKVESIAPVHNFEHGHVLGHLLFGIALLLETPHTIVAVERKVVARPHYH